MRHALMLAAAATILAACSQPETKTEPEAPAVATLPPGREATYAAAIEGPQPFVNALYAMRAAGATGETPPPGREPLYGRTLNAMIGADFRKANGEVPFLNYDLLCGCQDGALVLTSATVTPVDENHATAAVAFTLDGEPRTRTLKLVREGISWRVEDVQAPGEKWLSEQLLAVIE